MAALIATLTRRVADPVAHEYVFASDCQGCSRQCQRQTTVTLPGQSSATLHLEMTPAMFARALLHTLLLPLGLMMLAAMASSWSGIGEAGQVVAAISGMVLGALVCRRMDTASIRISEV